ncbi:Succinate dehydrogenase assembly factor 2, mitochondrial [Hondaea fermentalgiana]|uniref:Succinate dehydrogenase assembly factor 2, mitochondrial n=1 Tax=Hondaea fermentalgiana TaxID=2315210 RepID=A0A2R5G4V1_9STRA|nr:Succinate dehydrogenase assembly factor 2, mitochondrial [Hondaea fermentalgiana]|eukprot:GBG25359.1 Succinate dehydrogenase assembly factor 2, mitochondrial [Hondaea fermentalgiana]
MTGPTMVDLSKFATEEEQSKRLPHHAVLRDQELRKEHHAIRQSYPESAQPSEGPKVDAELAYRKRLLYRSKQRGWLEVDLLLGSWAADNIMTLSLEECAQFEAILNMETLDIYNMISGQMQVPDFLQTPIMEKLQKYCQSKPVGTADPTMYAKIKAKMSN